MLDLKVPFGKAPDGRMVCVDETERGLDCNCTCPECESPLVAAKGEVYRHHFKHATDSECGGAPETSLHKFAKQIICDRFALRLPGNYDAGRMVAAWPEHRLKIGVIPDVLTTFNEEIAVEIWVAHQVPTEKVRAYNKAEIAAVEIDLRSCRDAANSTEVWAKIVLATAPRRWISPPKPIREAQRILREQELERRRKELEEAARQRALAEAALVKAREEEAVQRKLAEQRRAEQTAAWEEEKALRRAEQERRDALEEIERQRREIWRKEAELRAAVEEAKHAEFRNSVRAAWKAECQPPDLQALVVAHGTYDRITPEAWARFDKERKLWKDRCQTNWFRLEKIDLEKRLGFRL